MLNSIKHSATLLLSSLFCIFFASAAIAVNPSENIFFIRLNIDDNTIEPGVFNALLQKEVSDVIPLAEGKDVSVLKMKNYLNGKITPGSNLKDLFFLHAMWGSNNWFVRSQVLDFSLSYTERTEAGVEAVFYILWDTKVATYSGNADNARRSSLLLQRLFELLYAVQEESNNHFDLLCHSMGNKVFFELMQNGNYKEPLFDHLLFAAADVNSDLLQDSITCQNITAIARNCNIFYNNYDGLLFLSSLRNSYTPLGFRPDTSVTLQYPNIRFINCSFLTDNNKFPGSLTGHMYYSTSMATKRTIRNILNSE